MTDHTEYKNPSPIGMGSKGQKKADMDFIPYRLFSIVPPFLVVSKCALAGGLFKPPSGREGDHEVVEGACVTLGLC